VTARLRAGPGRPMTVIGQNHAWSRPIGERCSKMRPTDVTWRSRSSKPSAKKQHQKNDQKDGNKPETAVAVPIPVTSESPAESTG
jgi:hypothetical protein